MNDENAHLLVTVKGYSGSCQCGANLTADYLLLSPIRSTNNNSSIYLCIGVMDADGYDECVGHRFVCPECHRVITVVEVHEPEIIVKDWVQSIADQLNNEKDTGV